MTHRIHDCLPKPLSSCSKVLSQVKLQQAHAKLRNVVTSNEAGLFDLQRIYGYVTTEHCLQLSQKRFWQIHS